MNLRIHRSLAIQIAACATLTYSSTAFAQLQPGEPSHLFKISSYAKGVASATDIQHLDDGRAVITMKSGAIAIVSTSGVVNPAAGRIPGDVDTKSEKGLLSVVADPDFEKNQKLYFYVSLGDKSNNKDKHHVKVATLSKDNKFTFAEKDLVSKGLEGPANHDGGGMVIHKGQLYIAVGDTGANATPPKNKYTSCLNVANGSILRINLDGTIPEDNPLVGLDKVTGCKDRTDGDFSMEPPDTRIYAWGLRNPYRFWIDPVTDLLWIGDVGERAKEEISVGGKGTHFGYPFWEGTVSHISEQPKTWSKACEGMTPSRKCTPPVFDYQNEGKTSNNCVTGGLIPSHCSWPSAYRSKYFFGDFTTGNIWTLDVNEKRDGVKKDSHKLFANVGNGFSGLRQGPNGALYIVQHRSDSIIKLEPKKPEACEGAKPNAKAAVKVASNTPAIVKKKSACGCRIGAADDTDAASLTLFGIIVFGVFALRTNRRQKRS